MQKKIKAQIYSVRIPLLHELRKTNPALFKSFYSSPVAKALILLKTGRYVEVNRMFLKLFECKRNDIIGKTPDELGLWANSAQRKKVLSKYVKDKKGSFNFDVKSLKGKIKNVIVSSEIIEIKGNNYLLGNIQDVTAIYDYELKLKESEHKYGIVLNNTQNVIYEFNLKDNEYNYISPSTSDLLGIPSKIFFKKKKNVLAPKILKEDRKRIKEHFRSLNNSKGSNKKHFNIEYRFNAGKNKVKWLNDSHTVIYDNKSKPITLVGHISDITFRKDAQEKLLRSYKLQQRYLDLTTTIQNSLPANIAMLDQSGNIIAVNNAWKKFGNNNGLNNENYCIGENYIEVCKSAIGPSSEEAKDAAKGIKNVLNGKIKEFIMEYPCHSPNEMRWFRFSVSPVKNKFNQGAVVMHVNITERKIAELTLKDSEDQYRLLFYKNPLPMWIFDFETLKFISVNDAAIKHYGYSKSEFLSMKLTDIRPKSEIKRYNEFRNSVIRKKTKKRSYNAGIWKHKKKSGEVIDVEVTRTSIKYNGKEAVLVLAKDVTELLRSKQILNQKNEEINLLYESHKDISSSLKTGDIFNKVHRIISKVIPCDSMFISSFDSKTKKINCISAWIKNKQLNVSGFPELTLDTSGAGMQSNVIMSKKSWIVKDFDLYAGKNPNILYVFKNNTVKSKLGKNDKVNKSALLVPMIFHGKVMGVIQVLSYKNNIYTTDHLHILESLSGQISSATANALLYQRAENEIKEKLKAEEALNAKNEELQILYDSQQVLSGSLDIESIYDKTYRIVSSHIQCDSMIISSYDKNDEMIKVLSIWADGGKPEFKSFPQIPLAPVGYGIQSEVIRTGKSQLITDYFEHYRKTKTRYSNKKNQLMKITKVKYKSALVVPMIHEGNVIGVIQVLSYLKNAYDDSKLKLMESLSFPITAATINASLYKQAKIEIEEKQKAREELALRNKEITLLYRAGRELLSTLNLEEIYEIFYSKLKEVIPCDSLIISEYKRKDMMVYCKAAWVENTKHNHSEFPPLKMGTNYKGTQVEAIVTGNSLIVNNFYEIIKERKDKYLIDDSGNVLNNEEPGIEINEDTQITRSALYIPMKLGRNVIGVISVFSFKANAYTEYDLKILESISVNLSVATANAELYKRAQTEIEERTRKEDELKQIRKNLEEAQRIAHIGSWVYDVRKGRLYNSSELYKILGFEKEPEGFEFEEAMQFIHEEDRPRTIDIIMNAVKNRMEYENEDRIVRPDGEVRYVKIVGEPMYDEHGEFRGIQGTLQDITEVKRINEELVRSLSEKELMLKEIHHRVKNNLQIVSSLLRLQAEKISDKSAVEHFRLSEQRIKSMALIHQQLYKTKDLSRINFRDYLYELCSYLIFANDANERRITFKIEAEEMYFGIDTALPCGLIINELFTNAVKHAFPNAEKGNIKVIFQKQPGDKYLLTIKDNGIGAVNLDLENTTSLGMELVNTLTEQLEGEISFNVNNGTEININFKDQKQRQ